MEDKIYEDTVVHGKTRTQSSKTPNMVQIIVSLCKGSKTADNFLKFEVSMVVKIYDCLLDYKSHPTLKTEAADSSETAATTNKTTWCQWTENSRDNIRNGDGTYVACD